MQNIFASSNVLKVANDIIRWSTINVVHLFLFWAWTDERGSNKSMHLHLPIFTFHAEIYGLMAAFSRGWLQYLPNESGFAGACTSHAPMVGHLVPSIKPWGWFPCFHKVDLV